MIQFHSLIVKEYMTFSLSPFVSLRKRKGPVCTVETSYVYSKEEVLPSELNNHGQPTFLFPAMALELNLSGCIA